MKEKFHRHARSGRLKRERAFGLGGFVFWVIKKGVLGKKRGGS